MGNKENQANLPPKIQEALDNFTDIYLEKLPPGLPPSTKHDHAISLKPGAVPASKPVCKLSHAELKELRSQLAELLEKGLIAPSKSPWGAPLLFAPKASGGLRMCIDYRVLNKLTARNQYPLPLPEGIFGQLHGAIIFSKIDLTQGFCQTRVDPESAPLAAFRCRHGHFEWKVAPFGLTNAPATLMNFMSNALGDCVDRFALARLDDILVRSSTADEHAEHLRQVHQKLKDNRLYCHPKKCSFAKSQVEFLGHVASKGGVAVDQAKIHTIEAWPTPQTKLTLQSFLGLANYYRRFMRRRSHIAKPLTLLAGGAPCVWADSQQQAFESLKHALTHAPVLRCYTSNDSIRLHTDASDQAISGALSQADNSGLTRPVAFFSSTLSQAAQNYPPHERELMAIVESMRHWRARLRGAAFEVLSDHNPLEHLLDQKNLSKKQARWLEDLADYDFTISCIRGKENTVADALSRQGSPGSKPSTDLLLRSARSKTNPSAVSLGAVTTTSCAMLSDSQRSDIIQQCHYDHDFATTYLHPTPPCAKASGLLRKDDKLCAPQGPFRKQILISAHDSITAGHLGQAKTEHSAKLRCFWPSMTGDIKERARACLRCQQNKALNTKKAGFLHTLQAPQRKWGSVSADFIMPLTKTPNGHDGVLAVVDRMTKAAALMPIRQTINAQETALKFKQEVLRHFGAPDNIVSDRGPRFTSAFWSELRDILNAQLAMPTAFHPQTDGQTERMNRALEEMARSCVDETHQHWGALLGDLEFACNNSINATTGFTPLFLNLGQHPRALEDVILAPPLHSVASGYLSKIGDAMLKARAAIAKASLRNQCCANQKRRAESFSQGDEVLLSTEHISLPAAEGHTKKLLPKCIGPFPIARKIGELSCELALPSALPAHNAFHVDKLRRCHKPADASHAPKPPQPGIYPDGHEEQEVELIVSHRLQKKQGRLKKSQKQRPTVLQHLARCKGFDSSHDQWMRDERLGNCRELIADYQTRVGATLNLAGE